MDLQQANVGASGARGPLVLDGQTYLCDQVSPYHFGQLAQWLKARKKPTEDKPAIIMTLVQDPGFKELTEKQQNLLLEKVTGLLVPKRKSPEDRADEVREALHDVDGCAYLIWTLVRENHQGLKHSDLVPVVEKLTPEYVLTLAHSAAGFDALEDDAKKKQT